MMHKELVFIGLGRMGLAMSTHLVEQGWFVHGYDKDETARAAAAEAGVNVHTSLAVAIEVCDRNPITEVGTGDKYVVERFTPVGSDKPPLRSTPSDTFEEAEAQVKNLRRTIWLMVPSQFVDDALSDIKPHLVPGDTVIDGGNSFFKDSLRRHAELKEIGVHFVDCGVSGGIDGARHGASLMVGGTEEVVTQRANLFTDLATEHGWARVGGPGAGHFVKMVHNGIEYGMMGAIAEGMNTLYEQQEELQIDLTNVLDPYEHGSIISSSLMSWLANAYRTEGYLDAITGEVPHGETEGEMEYLINQGKTPILAAAVEQRKATRETPSYIGKLIAAMRNQFGGHATINKPK